MITNDFTRGAIAILAYIRQTGSERFVADVYGADHHPSYLAEKALAWERSPIGAINRLDSRHIAILLKAADDRYSSLGAYYSDKIPGSGRLTNRDESLQ